MIDAEKKPEALKILDKLWDLTKKKRRMQILRNVIQK